MPEQVVELTYQHYILTEFQERKSRNPSYSLRAFARDVGVAAPKLSEILRGKKGLSEASARKLAPRLGLSKEESDLFVNLVIAKHARRQHEREGAEERLKQLTTRLRFNEASLDSFKVISDWYHFAILELCDLPDFQSSPSWIAKRLQISEKIATEAVHRLFDLGLLAEKKKGQWYQTEAVLATPSGIPSSAIRNHHRQVLTKAEEALTKFSVEERDFSATTLAVSESHLEEARKMIKTFRRDLAKKLSEAPRKDRVFCLSIQFFPLDRKKELL